MNKKTIRTKRMEQIIRFLGRKPKGHQEYKNAWRYLFEGDIEKRKIELRKQRQRHLNHTGPANSSRGYCIFCENEKT